MGKRLVGCPSNTPSPLLFIPRFAWKESSKAYDKWHAEMVKTYELTAKMETLFLQVPVQRLVIEAFAELGVRASFRLERPKCPIKTETRRRHCFKPQADGKPCKDAMRHYGTDMEGKKHMLPSTFHAHYHACVALNSELPLIDGFAEPDNMFPEYRRGRQACYTKCGIPLETSMRDYDYEAEWCSTSCMGFNNGHAAEQTCPFDVLFVLLEWGQSM